MTRKTQQLTLTAMFLALCVIVPIVFHLAALGKFFLPMFLPIILAGFIIEYPLAIFVGLLGPVTSALMTGMPPLFPMALLMTGEGVAATAIVAYLYHKKKVPFGYV